LTEALGDSSLRIIAPESTGSEFVGPEEGANEIRCNKHTKSAFADYRRRYGRNARARHEHRNRAIGGML
jgi:hypothetical protein